MNPLHQRMKSPLIAVLILTASAASIVAADDKKAAPVTEASAVNGAGLKDVTVDEAEKLIKERKDVVILDVRTPEEFESGHIAGAKNIDAMGDEFQEKLGALDRSKPYVIHCAAGGRSTRMLQKMEGLGFKSVYHMKAGMSGWKDAGKPVQK